MICTFGDTTDVTWWRELQLPTRTIVGRDGRIARRRRRMASPSDDAAGALRGARGQEREAGAAA